MRMCQPNRPSFKLNLVLKSGGASTAPKALLPRVGLAMNWPVVLSFILAALAVLSFGLTLWQGWVAWRFPLHQPDKDFSHSPPVTLLKPLKGRDAETERCLRS